MDAVIRYFSTEPGRFFFSLFLTAVGFLAFFRVLKRPKSDLPPTWAQSMAGAMAVFAMFLLCYGVVPHEWLTWADSKLGLREDKILLDTYAIQISGRALRDTVAATFYIIFLGLNVATWVMWQKRGTAKPKAAVPATATPSGTSAFSRPVTKKD
ncbi:MAG TPA: hypothetical protein VGL92_04095 [Acidimicrobiia bacterium]